MKRAATKAGMRRATTGTIPTRPTGVLDDLDLFVAVAQHSSFAEAARRTVVGTSSVSRAVARLEEQLGVVLLRRTSRKVVLTDEGRQLLQYAAPHVDGLKEALAATAEQRAQPSGLVRITAPTYTGATRVARALAAFALAHPQIRIDLDASNELNDLLEEGFDFAIRVGPIVDADFVVRHLWRGEFGLFAAPAFVRGALGGRTAIARERLERGPCIVLRSSAIWRFRDAKGRAAEVKPGVRFAVNDPRGALEVARQGLGIALAPLDAVADGAGELVALTTELGAPEPIDLFVVYPTRRMLPLRVRLTIDWLAGSKR
jgi:LysR family transcriptional regulator AphB